MCLLFAGPTSTHGVFTSFSLGLSQYCCLHFWKNKFGSMLAQGFLRVKSQAKITKCYFLWVDEINMQFIEWPLFDAPTSTHGVFTSFSLPQYCCLHFWRNKVGSMLAQGFFRVNSQAKITKFYLVSWRNKYAIIEWPLFDATTSTHGVFTSFSLSRCCYLHFCTNKFGLMLAQGYFKGQRSGIIH